MHAASTNTTTSSKSSAVSTPSSAGSSVTATKTTVFKSKTITQSRPHALGGASYNIDNTNREIEEISKKISEHADALYHTWKSRGLAPTELLGIYAHAAGSNVSGDANDLFAVTDDTAEGLQKLVNTFIIKDKEQRAFVKTKDRSAGEVKSGVIGTAAQTTAKPAAAAAALLTTPEINMVGKLKQQTKNGGAQKSSSSTSAIQMQPASGVERGVAVVDTLKKKSTKTSSIAAATTSVIASSTVTPVTVVTSPSIKASTSTTTARTVPATTTATATAISSAVTTSTSSARAASLGIKTDAQLHKHHQQQTKIGATSINTGTTTATAIATPVTTTKIRHASNSTATAATLGKTKPLSNAINLNLDLNLDITDLSELQTHNLRKIKELLQENATTPATTSATLKASPTTPTASPTSPSSTSSATLTNNAKTKKSASPFKLEDVKVASRRTTRELTAKSTNISNDNNSNNNSNSNNRRDIASASGASGASRVSGAVAGSSGGGDIGVTVGGANKEAITIGIAVNEVDGTANNVADKNSSRSSAATSGSKRSTATKVNAKSAPENQSPLPAQQSSSGNKVKDNEKSTSTRIATTSSGQSGNTSGGNKLTKPINKGDISNDTNNNISTSSSSSNSNNNNRKSVLKTNANRSVGATTAASTTTSPTTTATKKDTKSISNGAVGTENVMAMPAAPTKLSKTGRPLVNGQDKYVGRPILTRGSVAERVLMFEKCPDVRNSFLNIKRPDPADSPPKSLLKVKLHSTPPPPPEHNSIQREIRTTKSGYIPRFYFPHGKPQPQIALERVLRGILGAFDSFPNNQVTKDELPRILKICGLPFYWRMPVMIFCQQTSNVGLVERQRFVEFWKQMNVYCHDAASRFVYIMSRGQRFRSYILPEDLAPLVQDVVDTHPGLAFLKEATEFHSRYVHTVIARIFYAVNRSWSGRISISELKKSDLLEVISLLEEEDDINQIMAFFSYEHFYVIYCKFWELDKDHDLLINQDDLARHSDHALSTRIVERIFSGCVTRSDNKKNSDDEAKMSYTDFVWFLLSEEDKRTQTAIEYWFRCMDIDGDGMLSMYELEYFYEEQQQRMESIGIETLPFEDCLCQMLDMIKPARRDCITLGDLKRCKMTHVFFDTFFNLEKYLDHEQRDPFASQRDEYGSDWDRFAAQEYELLISEENE